VKADGGASRARSLSTTRAHQPLRSNDSKRNNARSLNFIALKLGASSFFALASPRLVDIILLAASRSSTDRTSCSSYGASSCDRRSLSRGSIGSVTSMGDCVDILFKDVEKIYKAWVKQSSMGGEDRVPLRRLLRCTIYDCSKPIISCSFLAWI
jgi:hypothetical protein